MFECLPDVWWPDRQIDGSDMKKVPPIGVMNVNVAMCMWSFLGEKK